MGTYSDALMYMGTCRVFTTRENEEPSRKMVRSKWKLGVH